jgi:AraC family transcriptional regulator
VKDRRHYGDSVAHSFHLDEVPYLVTKVLKSAQVAISRLSLDARNFGLSPRIPPEDTFILAIYLTAVPDHELLSKGRTFLRQGYLPGGMRIVNLTGEFSARIMNAHESLVFYIPRHVINEFTEGAELPIVSHIACEAGLVDPVIVHLAKALLPAFERPHEVNQLFLDHVVLALLSHLLDRFGDLRRPASLMKGGLSLRQKARAEAFLAANFARNVSLGEAASHCGLSRAHFARAFRQTIGIPPHQWLLRYRIDRAKAMMLDNPLSVAEVAIACGFADQSHLTRVFTRTTGLSPGAWRQEQRTRLRGI